MKKLLETLYITTPESYLFERNGNICISTTLTWVPKMFFRPLALHWSTKSAIGDDGVMGVDSGNLGKRIRNMRRGVVAIHGFHFSYNHKCASLHESVLNGNCG